MTKPALDAAIREAQRFLKLARSLSETVSQAGHYVEAGTRLSGATRRASLDLTRALADLRRIKR